jgi:hypothetical protein
MTVTVCPVGIPAPRDPLLTIIRRLTPLVPQAAPFSLSTAVITGYTVIGSSL